MLLFKQSIKKFETGAALIEFAIIVPLLLLLVVGISEFGYAFYHLNILNKSVQDGARYFSDSKQARNGVINASIDVSSGNPSVAKTKNLVIYGNTAGTCDPLKPCPLMPTVGNYTPAPTVDCVATNGQIIACSATTQHIIVTATYNHNLMTNDLLSNLMKLVSGGNSSVGSDIPLTASSVLRVE